MCAVDQKRSFFPRAVPFLDLLPFQGPFPLTGALTGKPPYGTAPYGEASYEKAPYELQESLRETTGRDFTRIGREFPLVRRRPKKVVFSEGCAVSGPSALSGTFPPYRGPYGDASYEKAPYDLQESLREATGRDFTSLGGNFRLCAVDQKRPFFPRAVPFLDLLPFQGPFPLTGALTGRPPYGKAPYGEASYEKAPYELQESLREATGRDFTRIGREFPLVRRRPKKVVFS